jgi:hypothetical protein
VALSIREPAKTLALLLVPAWSAILAASIHPQSFLRR